MLGLGCSAGVFGCRGSRSPSLFFWAWALLLSRNQKKPMRCKTWRWVWVSTTRRDWGAVTNAIPARQAEVETERGGFFGKGDEGAKEGGGRVQWEEGEGGFAKRSCGWLLLGNRQTEERYSVLFFLSLCRGRVSGTPHFRVEFACGSPIQHPIDKGGEALGELQ